MIQLRYHLAIASAAAGLAVLLAAGAAVAQPAEWLDILPDASLKGWTRVPIPATDGLKPIEQWRVDPEQKALICSGKGGHEWLRWNRELADFILEADWRFTPLDPAEKRYNSGIGIRLSPWGEIWYQAQTGLTGGYLFGQNFADGAFSRFNLSKQMKENRVKPAGEWNHYEITAKGDRITMAVNGEAVSELTGVGLRRGYIGFEAEHYEIAFRNIRVKILE
ncbi:MAG: DUF1080 domain-containing protein [Acidobacteria bacterium]|nr:DUF1080 domain-containing protein [Acidobacteriota bacterium]